MRFTSWFWLNRSKRADFLLLWKFCDWSLIFRIIITLLSFSLQTSILMLSCKTFWWTLELIFSSSNDCIQPRTQDDGKTPNHDAPSTTLPCCQWNLILLLLLVYYYDVFAFLFNITKDSSFGGIFTGGPPLGRIAAALNCLIYRKIPTA